MKTKNKIQRSVNRFKTKISGKDLINGVDEAVLKAHLN